MEAIIYNVTVNVDDSIHQDWLVWIKEHIPEVLATGQFIDARFTRVLTKQKDEEGTTYSIQYKAKSRVALDNYYNNYAEALRNDGMKKFEGKMIAFRTELEVLDEYHVTVS